MQEVQQNNSLKEVNGIIAKRKTIVATSTAGVSGSFIGLASHGPAGLAIGGIATIAFLVLESHGTPEEYAKLANILGPSVRAVKRWTKRRMSRPAPKEADQSCVTLEQAQPLLVTQANEQPKQHGLDDALDFAAEDELARPMLAPNGPFYFSDVLRVFTPTLDKIYLGTLPNGTMVFIKARDLCHTALAGATRGGKSQLIRQLMSQLCYAGANVYLLNPHYIRYDLETVDPAGRSCPEDWTPFEARLKNDPRDMISLATKYQVIEHYLKVSYALVGRRLEKSGNGERLGAPHFLFIDELPAIIDEIPDAPKYLKRILREGAKVGVFVVNASQDFLVTTVFKEIGGAIRDCYRTAFDVGSSYATQNALGLPNLKGLGKGKASVRCDDILSEISVPYVDNKALYALLGPSTYTKPGRTIEEEEDEIVAYTMQSGRREERYTDEEPHTDPLPVRGVTSGVRTVRSAVERKQERDQRFRGMSVAASRQAVQVTRVPETPQIIVPSQKPEPTMKDALGVWNEVVGAGGKLSRYSLRDRLVQQGFECGENKARDLLAELKVMAEKSVGG